jgi:uncharacterized membrane protein YfcA
MDILDIIAVAGIIFLASAIQSAVGFAFALFSTPLLLWIGIPLPSAIAAVAVCSFVQAILGARHLRASVPWRLSLIATGVRVATIIVGLLILKRMANLDTGGVRLVVGCVLCVLVVIQLTSKVHPSRMVHWLCGGLAFSTSGLLVGVCGMGGPPMVLWSLAHNWPMEKTRGFLFAVMAVSIPIQIALLYMTFGGDILRATAMALLLAPVVFLGAAIGLPLGNQMPKEVLRRIVHLILLAIGLGSIIPAVVQALGW